MEAEKKMVLVLARVFYEASLNYVSTKMDNNEAI